MQTPLQITFRNIQKSDAVESYVRERAAKLERFCPRITGCHVALEAPHRHKKHGHHFRVRIDLAIPGDELVVSRDQAAKKNHENLYAAVDAAFDGAKRMIDDHVQRQREFVHERAVAPAAVAS
jgi:ribosomal subunit interface protein